MEDIRPTPDSTKSKGRNRNRKPALRTVTSDTSLLSIPSTPLVAKATEVTSELQDTVKMNSAAIKTMSDTMGSINGKIEELMLSLAPKTMLSTPVVEPTGKTTSSDDEQVTFGNMGFTPTIGATSSHNRSTTVPISRNIGKLSIKKKHRESLLHSIGFDNCSSDDNSDESNHAPCYEFSDTSASSCEERKVNKLSAKRKFKGNGNSALQSAIHNGMLHTVAPEPTSHIVLKQLYPNVIFDFFDDLEIYRVRNGIAPDAATRCSKEVMQRILLHDKVPINEVSDFHKLNDKTLIKYIHRVVKPLNPVVFASDLEGACKSTLRNVKPSAENFNEFVSHVQSYTKLFLKCLTFLSYAILKTYLR